MPKRVEDIVPPEKRPEEVPLPEVTPTHSFHSDEEDLPQEEEESETSRLDHELPPNLESDTQRYIDDPPPFISRIPPRDGTENTFLDRPREERAPLSVKTEPRQSGGFFRRHTLVLVGLVLVTTLYIDLSLTFRKVTITVTPKIERAVLNAHLTATKDMPGKLSYTVLTLTATETQDVIANGTKTVNAKATGKIIVYNEYSAKSQRLIKNTRFQSTDGKIYRIAESITVPGVTTVSGKSVPGRIEVTVYADEPGVEYNIPLTDFTIPGLKGDPRFNKMYARSKTPMTGGFSGSMRVVSDEDLAKTRQELEATLKERLLKEAREGQPKEYVFYTEGTYLVTRPLERIDIPGENEKVRLESGATLHVLLFPRGALAQEIAKNVIPAYDGAPLTISNIDLLRVEVTPKGDGDPWAQEQVLLALAGDAELIWDVDIPALQQKLIGSQRGTFNAKMGEMAAIDEAKVAFRPFWWPGGFPTEQEKIHVELNIQGVKKP